MNERLLTCSIFLSRLVRSQNKQPQFVSNFHLIAHVSCGGDTVAFFFSLFFSVETVVLSLCGNDDIISCVLYFVDLCPSGAAGLNATFDLSWWSMDVRKWYVNEVYRRNSVEYHTKQTKIVFPPILQGDLCGSLGRHFLCGFF